MCGICCIGDWYWLLKLPGVKLWLLGDVYQAISFWDCDEEPRKLLAWPKGRFGRNYVPEYESYEFYFDRMLG